MPAQRLRSSDAEDLKIFTALEQVSLSLGLVGAGPSIRTYQAYCANYGSNFPSPDVICARFGDWDKALWATGLRRGEDWVRIGDPSSYVVAGAGQELIGGRRLRQKIRQDWSVAELAQIINGIARERRSASVTGRDYSAYRSQHPELGLPYATWISEHLGSPGPS